MPEIPSENNPANSRNGDRIPRLAIGVVILGVIATLAIYGLSFLPGSGSLEVEWDTVEAIEFPATKDVGQGSFGVSRTTLSALAPLLGVASLALLWPKGETTRADNNARNA